MKSNINKGEIYYVSSNVKQPPIGCEIWSDRPALVVSNNTTNNNGGAIMVVYLSTSLKKQASPAHIKIDCAGRKVTALCEQIHTVDRSRIHQKIDTITEKEMESIDKSLCMTLAIDMQSYRSVFKKWENYIRQYHIEVTNEQESIKNFLATSAVNTLMKQIEILEKERDAYKALAEAKTELLDQISINHIL